MRTKSIELMKQICKFAENFILDNNRSPSTTEIADEFRIARGTAYRYLVDMNERKLIEYDGHSIQTEVTLKYKSKRSQAAIVGSIPCGSPQYEEEHIEAYVSLPESIFGSGEFYILRASGNSMIEAGIDDGDLVVIKKQKTANEGDIVVALVDGQNTLKRYYIDRRKRRVRLHPENSEMKDLYVNECEIQGVAQHVIKAL